MAEGQTPREVAQRQQRQASESYAVQRLLDQKEAKAEEKYGKKEVSGYTEIKNVQDQNT